MPKFLNEKEVAQLLRCSLSKLRADRWKQTGLPYVKLGKSVLYEENTILNTIDNCRIKTKQTMGCEQ